MGPLPPPRSTRRRINQHKHWPRPLCAPHPLCKMSPSPVALSSKTSAPESKQFFLYVFPQEKNSKKKSVLSLFPKQKEFNWPSDFNLSLSFTTLLSYCSVFQICTRLHSICGQEKQKLFSSKNSLFINAWDSRILKEKRKKKIIKK